MAVSHQQGAAIAAALRTRGVVPDFRPPDLFRLAPVALDTSFFDCYRAIEILRETASCVARLAIALSCC